MFEAADEYVYGFNLVIDPALSGSSPDHGLIDIFVAAHEAAGRNELIGLCPPKAMIAIELEIGIGWKIDALPRA
ncbi:hypothetical protein ACC734_39695, partial [Rhizobium ruizarguesonis]